MILCLKYIGTFQSIEGSTFIFRRLNLTAGQKLSLSLSFWCGPLDDCMFMLIYLLYIIRAKMILGLANGEVNQRAPQITHES